MQRRWLRDNPHLPGNPVGRGIGLLQDLDQAAVDAQAVVEPHWRRVRARGVSANQVTHMREKVGAWEQLPSDEQGTLKQAVLDEGGIPPENWHSVMEAAMLARWSDRVRETNRRMGGIELRINDLRALQVRHEVDNASADEVQAVQDEIRELADQCRGLQTHLVQELLAACIDVLPTLMHRLLKDGIFLPDEVREFRGFSEVSDASAPLSR